MNCTCTTLTNGIFLAWPPPGGFIQHSRKIIQRQHLLRTSTLHEEYALMQITLLKHNYDVAPVETYKHELRILSVGDARNQPKHQVIKDHTDNQQVPIALEKLQYSYRGTKR